MTYSDWSRCVEIRRHIQSSTWKKSTTRLYATFSNYTHHFYTQCDIYWLIISLGTQFQWMLSGLSKLNLAFKRMDAIFEWFATNFLTKKTANDDIVPMVPIIIDSRNPDKGSSQQRQNQREKLPGVTSSVKEPNLSCQVHCQVSKSSKRPCTSLRPAYPGWNPSQSWKTSINLASCLCPSCKRN